MTADQKTFHHSSIRYIFILFYSLRALTNNNNTTAVFVMKNKVLIERNNGGVSNCAFRCEQESSKRIRKREVKRKKKGEALAASDKTITIRP